MVAAVGLGRRSPVDRVSEASLEAAVVGLHVREAQHVALARPEDDGGVVGCQALDGRDSLAVEAELQRVRRARMARELRVEHLVGPGAEGRRPFHPFEEVRDPAPAVEHEHGLVDVLRARPHRRDGARCRLLEVALLAELDRDDLASLREERLHEGRLVLLPLALAQIVEGVHVVRLLDLAARRRDLELRQVLAADEVTEIGRREAEGFAVELHAL